MPLTAEEQEEDLHKAKVDKFNQLMMRRLGIEPMVKLLAKTTWSSKGPVMLLEMDEQQFHLRKDTESDIYVLSLIEGQEREIARIEGSDEHFGLRVLVAIADATDTGNSRPV